MSTPPRVLKIIVRQVTVSQPSRDTIRCVVILHIYIVYALGALNTKWFSIDFAPLPEA